MSAPDVTDNWVLHESTRILESPELLTLRDEPSWSTRKLFVILCGICTRCHDLGRGVDYLRDVSSGY